ncbi:MAG: SDR family oxidoreductase [Actinobacteria bacterium]|nr:SDR family oxidoreductase [Actinomycetota bacterium]
MENISSRAVIVTGSTRGIGLATAAEFLRNGDKVTIFCRHQDHVDEAVERLSEITGLSNVSQNILGLFGDVRMSSDVREIVDIALRNFGRIDVLINNAGIAVWKLIEHTTEHEWDNVLDTNLKGSFLFIHEVMPIMKKQGSGVIINVSSGLGAQGQANYSAYSASKFGQIGLTQVVADETRDMDIKVYAILPGGVATKLHLDIHPWEDPSKMMTPEYIAKEIFQIAEGRKRSGASIEIYY